MAEREDILKNIRADGNRELHGETYSIVSEAWGCTIYFKRPSIAQQDKYLPLILDSKLEGYAEVIVQLALKDEVTGKKLFNASDKKLLINSGGPKEISRIGEFILTRVSEDALGSEEALGNSEKTDA